MFNNEFHFRGNLARDVFVGNTKNGGMYCRFTVAVNRPKKKDGSEGGADFIPCTAFGTIADSIQGMKKGEAVAVQGHYNSNRYQDANGEWQNGDSIIVESIARPIFKKKEPSGDFEQFGTAEPEPAANEPIPF